MGLKNSLEGCLRTMVGGVALLIIVSCIIGQLLQNHVPRPPEPVTVSPAPVPSSPQPPPTIQRPPEPPSLPPVELPPHRIISSDVRPPFKRALVVRLEEKISASELRSLGEHLKEQDSRQFERTFIMFLLPGMVDGAGAWATTHFEPNISVQILGMTIEQEKAARAASVMKGYEIAGQWIHEGSLAGVYTWHQDGGRHYLDIVYRDGSKARTPVRKKPSHFGVRLEPKKMNESGDHWLVNRSGDLESRDAKGLIDVMLKID